MVLKMGIDQLNRKQWEWTPWNENWISANWVNPGEPNQWEKIPTSEKRFNYGFHDFVIVECTPEIAYQVRKHMEPAAASPPVHVRAYQGRTERRRDYWGKKHFSGYTTMAYGWGNHGDILDSNCETNEYCDVEGPGPYDMQEEAWVKFIPLFIPGGLHKNDTFWIDLNKGVRALYFPARYIYHKEFPGDAAYAKISFVEESSRNLIDAESLFFGNMLSKMVSNLPLDLKGFTRENLDTVGLQRKSKLGAYSHEQSLIINVPQFIDACYLMHTPLAAQCNPHDAIYLAKSKDIKAKRIPFTDSYEKWRLPPEYYRWTNQTQTLMRSYAGAIGQQDQANLQQATTSSLDGETEFFVNIVLCAASLIPYVGPLAATLGAEVLENIKGLRTDSSEQEAVAAGITAKTWNALPGEAKDRILPVLKDAAKAMAKIRSKGV